MHEQNKYSTFTDPDGNDVTQFMRRAVRQFEGAQFINACSGKQTLRSCQIKSCKIKYQLRQIFFDRCIIWTNISGTA